MSCSSNNSEYHFYLPPGSYRLNAYGKDVQQAWKTIIVKPGQEKLEVEPIDLPLTRLVLLEGKPAPELRDITAWKNGGPVQPSDLPARQSSWRSRRSGQVREALCLGCSRSMKSITTEV